MPESKNLQNKKTNYIRQTKTVVKRKIEEQKEMEDLSTGD